MEGLQPIPKGHEHILFIDDEAVLAEMGKSMLEKLGYRVESATNPKEALELFRNGGDPFDMVITDQTMPGMSGAELAAEILAADHSFPVIICTGFSESITEEKARKLGIRALVLKPFVLREFARIVRDVLDDR